MKLPTFILFMSLTLLSFVSPSYGLWRFIAHMKNWNLPNCGGAWIACHHMFQHECCGVHFNWGNSAMIFKPYQARVSSYRGGMCKTEVREVWAKTTRWCLRMPNSFSALVWSMPDGKEKRDDGNITIPKPINCPPKRDDDPFWAIGQLGLEDGHVFNMSAPGITPAIRGELGKLWFNNTRYEDVPKELLKYEIEDPELFPDGDDEMEETILDD